ncbi:C-GCAxxG-C-C family protein [uncultured Draconibacterium sp.]|uniref:C-GCAxxG-C-C family protein n=1 Tax=uncultured Draconibacterium sp. TaxID=1573823 RepID=UPI002AA70F5A|nr:C-GCAxxG-C-C family protein [uncultured Draconibacterium sp.]
MMKELPNDNTLANQAAELFWQDYNCAQSVLAVYTDFYQIDKETAYGLSCGLGAGMGRLQGTCGAVSAAYMVFGLANADAKDNPAKVAKTYAMVQQFHKRYTDDKGSTVCKELINCDLNTEEGQNHFKANELKKNICEGCIRHSVKLINSVIRENSHN